MASLLTYIARAVDNFISLGVLSLSKQQITSESIDDCS